MRKIATFAPITFKHSIMKSSFKGSKKMVSYSAMAGAFMLTSGGLQAQVAYTDIDPDETYNLNGDLYELDLNLDGEIDFTFEVFDVIYPDFFTSINSAAYDGLFRFIWADALNGSIAASSGGTGGYIYSFPFVLNTGAIIGAELSWRNNSNQSMDGFIGVASYPAPGSTLVMFESGAWAGQSDKFIGLRLKDNGNDYYGWARFDVADNHHEFTIKDYAVQQTAETTIEAGSSVGVHNVIQNSELTAYSYDNTINVVVKDLHTSGATVKVFNMNGQIVYMNDLNMSGMIITLNEAATGNYTLQVVTAENSVVTKKLFIQN